jgi:hypothetical protein
MGADPGFDPDLTSGARSLLLVLRKRAGEARVYVTFTKSLATTLRKCTNTIRNWAAPLIEGGYIAWSTDPRTMQTTIRILDRVEPPERRRLLELQRKQDQKPMPLPWQPQPEPVLPLDPKPWGKPPTHVPWWKKVSKSKASKGGAQNPAHMNPSPSRSSLVPANHTTEDINGFSGTLFKTTWDGFARTAAVSLPPW